MESSDKSVTSSSSSSSPRLCTRYDGTIPAELEGLFDPRDLLVFFLGQKLFGTINYLDDSRVATILGGCDSKSGPIRHLTIEEWKIVQEWDFKVAGPYAVCPVEHQESDDIDELCDSIPVEHQESEEIRTKEVQDVLDVMLPIADLKTSIDNLPENKLLKEYRKDVAISLAIIQLKFMAETALLGEGFISKWVSDDYFSDNEEEEEEEEEYVECKEVSKMPHHSRDPASHVTSPRVPGSRILLSVNTQPATSTLHSSPVGTVVPAILSRLSEEKSVEKTESDSVRLKKTKVKKTINDKLREAVIRTPQPMLNPPSFVSEVEKEAWNNLSREYKDIIWTDVCSSPMHSHIVLTDLINDINKNTVRICHGKYIRPLNTMGKIMFYCLKRLRFGEQQDEKEPLFGENELEGGKKRWGPVDTEEQFRLHDAINRMIVKTSHFYITEAATLDFLNTFLPFWNIPGVNFTGSLCNLLSREIHDKDIMRFYTPTRYDLKWSDIEIDSCCWYGDVPKFTVIPVTIYFPVDGRSEFYTKKISPKYDNLGEGDISKIRNFLKKNPILKPSIDISKPMACVILYMERKRSFKLLEILPNTDCDVPVFKHEDLDQVALNVYSTVKKSGTVLKRIERGNGSHCWNIHMTPSIPADLASDKKSCDQYIRDYFNFYPVEIYRTQEHHIWTHHVAMTRIYGKCVDEKIEFSASPEQLYSVINDRSERYNYFAGKKSTVLSILNKYYFRGYDAPHYIERKFDLVSHFKREDLSIPVGLVTSKMRSWCDSV